MSEPEGREEDREYQRLRERVKVLEAALREIVALPYRKFIGFAKRIAIAALKEPR